MRWRRASNRVRVVPEQEGSETSMAAKSTPLVPKPLRPTHRRFTLAQANRALPLVERVVRDIVAAHEAARQLHGKLSSRPAEPVRATIERELELRLARLQSLVEELNDIGCELKDFRTGLVDFVGRHQGRDIHLCWKLGEPAITHWHETNSGFAGRQPIDKLQEDAG
ncbi:MAG TPA: DUF2203 domain-containing protein [Tepidisphaeraceae bacterium]|nr:DUF2203 domain-containing protein [Tepidisphaeraceae bacterium]